MSDIVQMFQKHCVRHSADVSGTVKMLHTCANVSYTANVSGVMQMFHMQR